MQDVTEQVRTGNPEDTGIDVPTLNALNAYFSKYETFTAYRLVGPNSKGQVVERVYVQDKLSVFLKQEFGEALTEFFETIVKGETGIDLKQIFRDGTAAPAIAVPSNPSEVEALIEDEGTIDLLKGILDLLRRLPTFQKKLIMIALGVPEGERHWAEQIISGPIYLGGLTDDDLENIATSFMKQNARDIRAFFTERRDRLAMVFREEVLLQDPKAIEGTATEKTNPEPDSTGTTPSSTTAAASV